MDKILELALPHIPDILVVLIGLAFTFMVRKKWIKEELAKKLEEDISAAVTATYLEYVKAKKLASEDGKLTEEEKKEARSIALKKLAEIGKEKGVDYAKTYGVPLIMSLVERMVQRNKND